MAVPVDQTFGGFFDGGALQSGDIIVGLRNGINTRFDASASPGIYLPLAGGTMTGVIDMDGHQIAGLPAPVDPDNATNKAYVDGLISAGVTAAEVQNSAFNYAVDSGVNGTAYIAALSPVPVLSDSLIFEVKPANTNTVTTPSLNLNGLGAKPIRLPNGQGLLIGDIVQNVAAHFQYVLGADQYYLLNPQQTSMLMYNAMNLAPIYIYTDTGILNALVISQPLFPNNVAQGTSIFVNPAFTNTGAATLEYNGLAKPITLQDGSALVAGEIVAGVYAEFIISPSFANWVLLNSQLSGGGSVTPDDIQQQAFTWAADTGVADAYVGVFTPPVVSLFPGARFDLTIQNDNTGSSTLDVGTGATLIVYADGQNTPISSGALRLGQIASFEYDGANFQLLNPCPTLYHSDSLFSFRTFGANTTGFFALAFGFGANAAQKSIVIGHNSGGSGQSTIAIGDTVTPGAANNAVAIGESATVSGDESVTIGKSSSAANFGVAMGAGANAGVRGVAIGTGAVANGSTSIALGYLATTTNQGSFVANDSASANFPESGSDQWVHTFSGGFFFAKDITTLWVNIDAEGNLINLKGIADQSLDVQAPASGFSITIGAGIQTLELNPAGTLATGTITMPALPIHGQVVRVASTQAITALTVAANAGQTISNAPTTLGQGSGFSFIYDLPSTNWFPLYSAEVGFANAPVNTNITSMTGLTGYIEAPLGVRDASSNNVITFTSVASAVNYINFKNAATGSSPQINFTGSDPATNGYFSSTSGNFIFADSTHTFGAVLRLMNAAGSFGTALIGGNNAANLDLTLPIVDEAGFMVSDGAGTLSFKGNLTDISSTVTVNGYSATTTKAVYELKIGKMVFINFTLVGTSNATTFSLTGLPNSTSISQYYPTIAVDNGVNGFGLVAIGTTTMTFYNNGGTSPSSWTNSGTKAIYGSIWYTTG